MAYLPPNMQPPEPATPCAAWLYRISRTTNEWWWKTGGDGTYLVTPTELGVHLLNWKKIETGTVYIEGVAEKLTPLFEAEKDVLEAELRDMVMTRASDRRLAMQEVGA